MDMTGLMAREESHFAGCKGQQSSKQHKREVFEIPALG